MCLSNLARQVYTVQIVTIINDILSNTNISRSPTGKLVSFGDKNIALDFIVVVAIVRWREWSAQSKLDFLSGMYEVTYMTAIILHISRSCLFQHQMTKTCFLSHALLFSFYLHILVLHNFRTLSWTVILHMLSKSYWPYGRFITVFNSGLMF